MSEAVQLSKGPGLIRRISRGATNKLIRRRQSSNSVTNRDQSSGPAIMRRASGTETDLDPGLEGDDEDALEEVPSFYGLGLTIDGTQPSTPPVLRKSTRAEGYIAPIIPPSLRNGTTLAKITKKKKKSLVVALDPDSAKVYWNPSNPSKRFYIDDIQEIRQGGAAKNHSGDVQVPEASESLWFTIIYADKNRAKGRPSKTMHLIAPNEHIFELWTSTLNGLWKYRQTLMKGLAGSGMDEKSLEGQWKREMEKRFGDKPRTADSENLNLTGVEALCRSLHINCSSNVIRAQFDKADTKHSGHLSYDDFKVFVRRLKERSDVKEIYRSWVVNGQEGIDVESFLNFLRSCQGIEVSADPAHWHKVFSKFVRKYNFKSTTLPASPIVEDSLLYMGFEAFCSFLFSTHNRVVPAKPLVTILDRPMNEYFISSSHNTYLLGRQVAGSSSTEAYIRALQRGCRCVELDCWDGNDGRPIVVHGLTLTTSVLFLDCISVISRYAFVASSYPLTLSLEVHCNAAQQQVMVDIMLRELGHLLVREPQMTNAFTLPSPEDLRNRILVKVKPAGEPLDCDPEIFTPGRRKRSVSSPWSRPKVVDIPDVPNMPALSSPPSISTLDSPSPTWDQAHGSITATSMSSATDDSDTMQSGVVKPRMKRKKRKSKIIQSLGALGVYTRGLKFADFTSPESKTYNHIFSLAERTFEGLCRDPDIESQLEKHNMRYLMRVYPSAFRMKSTNFDPLAFWRRGVQMVALNWQTYDLGMQMNDAMFAGGNDRTGYVLKPKELLKAAKVSEPTSELASPGLQRVQKQLIRFSVDMISAQQLPLPRGSTFDDSLDPYVEIEIFCAEDKGKGYATGEGGQDASARNGISGVGAAHRRRTDVVPSNGYNPVFDAKFKFSLETKYPDLVFVRWTVWDSPDGRNYHHNTNSDPLASFTAKLSSLQQGYRHLPLYDHNGDQFLFSTLFCKFVKEEPVTVERDDLVSEKLGRFKQLGQAVFKRTLSVEKRSSKAKENAKLKDNARSTKSVESSMESSKEE